MVDIDVEKNEIESSKISNDIFNIQVIIKTLESHLFVRHVHTHIYIRFFAIIINFDY